MFPTHVQEVARRQLDSELGFVPSEIESPRRSACGGDSLCLESRWIYSLRTVSLPQHAGTALVKHRAFRKTLNPKL